MAGIEIDAGVTDPELLAQAFNEIEKGGNVTLNDPAKADPAPEQATAANTEASQTTQQQGDQGQAATEEEPAGVATKDGKHVIPYSVLKGERERATRAEQTLAEMQAQIADLKAKVEAGNQGAKDGEGARTDGQDAVSDLSDEDLEALKEDFPTVYKGLKAMQAQAAALRQQLETVNASVKTTEAEAQRSQAETVQDAIDGIPKLAHIQANNAEAFALAQQFDATLRAQSAWKDKPLAERFQKVTEMVEAALGEISLPNSAAPSQGKVVDMKAAAEAKAKAAASGKGSVPTSLSQFPGGQAAATDELEAVSNMSAFQLAEKFASMTDAQMDAYLRKL